MSISHLSLVNQKLAYASALITLLTEPQARPPLEYQALLDAAAFHLAKGLHFYLRELAEQHRIKNLSEINSIQDLDIALRQVGITSSEAAELLSLTQLPGSWLHQLTDYYARLSMSPVKPREKKAFGAENLIELVDLTVASETLPLKLTPELLIWWRDSFRALILRQRDTTAEY